MLSDDDVKFYNENGYLIIPDVFSASEIAELRAATEELVEDSVDPSRHKGLYEFEDDHQPERPRVRRFLFPEGHHPTFAKTFRHPGVVECLKRLWGPNVRFDLGKLNLKMEKSSSAIEWHQDWAFYPHSNDDLAAVGIMIDDIDMENGPMLVVPGTHRGPVLDHNADGQFIGACDPALVDTERAVACTGRAGSISIHHVRTLHGSAPNQSSRPRRLLLNQYRSADAWPIMHPPSDFAAYGKLLVAGEETLTPRMENVPVRLPLPKQQSSGSIYEVQRKLANPAFALAT